MIFIRGKNFSVFQSVQICSGAHPIYSLGSSSVSQMTQRPGREAVRLTSVSCAQTKNVCSCTTIPSHASMACCLIRYLYTSPFPLLYTLFSVYVDTRLDTTKSADSSSKASDLLLTVCRVLYRPALRLHCRFFCCILRENRAVFNAAPSSCPPGSHSESNI